MERRGRTARIITFALVASIASAPAQAQTGTEAEGCLAAGFPCWVVGIVIANGALLLLVIVRTLVLTRRIRRGPRRTDPDGQDHQDLPPDLHDGPPAPAGAEPPPTGQRAPGHPPAPWTHPDRHAAWPDEEPDPSRASRARRSPRSADEQITWGDHRLWFDDGDYFFSADEDEDWLPCFAVPKGHRIVAGSDGAPRLERVDPRHGS